MKCLRPIFFSAVCMLLAAGLSGCFPSGDNSLDEEKDPHYQRGMDLINSQEYKAAVDEFERALETNPRSASAHYELGWLYEEKIKDYAAAIYHYQRHLALAPKSPRSQRVTDEIRGCKLDLVKTEFTLPSSQSLQQEVESLTQKNLLLQQQLDAARTLASAAASPPPQPGRAPTSAPAVSAPAPAPPPAPAPLPPVPDLSHPRLYVVQSHDTINSVATRYGLKPGVVLAANPNINPTRLRIGQTLNLP